MQSSFKSDVPNPRWAALKILEGDADLTERITQEYGALWMDGTDTDVVLGEVRRTLRENGFSDEESVRDAIVGAIYRSAQDICKAAVESYDPLKDKRRLKIDRLLTSRFTGTLFMLALLAVVFYITITVSNYPSQWLSDGLFWVQDRLTDLFAALNAPQWLHGALVLGVYRVLAWVVSVMLPPMAIFFPLFTLLEDVGYLPRIAFNLDRSFRRCGACGKQALTMCMGFGCNAVGVSGCRIIGSTRERLIAILTNNFVPCNGRFPTLIAVLTMFFAGAAAVGSVLPALLLTAVILLGVGMTFVFSKLLSVTVLKGVPSAFTLEMPPYRKPQIGKIIVRSIFDRTLFVLRRAAIVAAPAGLLLWLMANITVGGTTVLHLCTSFLDPFARMLGMDGVILMAFILGFPANEIVLPIVLMAYTASGTLAPIGNLASLHGLLTANGWTWLTAVCVVLFSLMHWPCSTTLITVHKETKSAKWTFLSFLIPTAAGMLLCFLLTSAVRLLQLA
jgi:ferrous iron transport protein B